MYARTVVPLPLLSLSATAEHTVRPVQSRVQLTGRGQPFILRAPG
jgi:hypothetical protein